jgi:hypothetical protein
MGPRVADGMIARFTITERPDGGFATSAPSVVPTMVQQGSYVVVPTARRGDPQRSAYLRRLLAASEARTRRVVGPYVAAA